MTSDTPLQWKWLRVFAAVSLAAVMATGAGCGQSDAPESDEAAADANLEQYERTLAVFEHRFGQMYEGEEDADRLIADLDAFVQQHPNQFEARRLYAQTLQLARRFEPAYEQFEAAVKLRPNDVELRLLVGDTAMQMQAYNQAQRHYSQAADLEPDDVRFRVRLAQSLIEQQRYDEARNILLREVLPRDSSHYPAYVTLSDLYARQNKIELALDQITRALELVPESETHRRLLYVRRQSTLLRRANRPSEALAVLRELAPEQQMRIDVSQDMARSWMMLGQPERAANHFDFLLSRDPSDDLAAAEAANWHLRAGQYDEARRRVDQLRRINPRSPALPALERSLAEEAEG